MKRFVFVRHSQASALAVNYDEVSELGYRQARALGEHWVESGQTPSRIFIGTHERHRQTCDEMLAAASEAGERWPEPEAIPELDEHAGTGLVDGLLPILAKTDAAIAAFLENPPPERERLIQAYFGFFRTITRRWAEGEFQDNGTEHWLDFRARVRRGVDRIVEETSDGETTLVITSGGPVAATAGTALELNEQRTLELSWIVHNTAMTELFLREPETLRLKSFNRTPHLAPELHTYV